MKRRIAIVSVLTGIGLLLWIVEEMISLPLPIKLGISNISTLVALYIFGSREALYVTLGRIFIGALILGRLFSLTMLLSLSGGVLALIAMLALKDVLSIVGTSVAGGWFNIVGQFTAAYFLIYSKTSLFNFFPLFGIAGIIAGAIVGFLSSRIIGSVKSALH